MLKDKISNQFLKVDLILQNFFSECWSMRNVWLFIRTTCLNELQNLALCFLLEWISALIAFGIMLLVMTERLNELQHLALCYLVLGGMTQNIMLILCELTEIEWLTALDITLILYDRETEWTSTKDESWPCGSKTAGRYGFSWSTGQKGINS